MSGFLTQSLLNHTYFKSEPICICVILENRKYNFTTKKLFKKAVLTKRLSFEGGNPFSPYCNGGV